MLNIFVIHAKPNTMSVDHASDDTAGFAAFKEALFAYCLITAIAAVSLITPTSNFE